MCSGLAELREAMKRYAARFDPALLSGADAALVVKEAAAIENMAATVKALAAARVADTGTWRKEGDRSAAHHLARMAGTSVGQAAEAIDTAHKLESLPEVAASARSGELSSAQSTAIASAAGGRSDRPIPVVGAGRHGVVGRTARRMRLCKHHHFLKTRDGWALVEGVGKRAFVPPDDPRHPCHSGNGPPSLPSRRPGVDAGPPACGSTAGSKTPTPRSGGSGRGTP